MPTVSLATVLVSALVSVVTGYVGALLNLSRQRRAERRVYGLALLAEIKAIQRGLLRYRARIDRHAGPAEPSGRLRHELSLWRHDLSVYANNSGRIGLFSVRTAIEIIEFYHRIRWLDVRIGELAGTDLCTPDLFAVWMAEHRETLRRAQVHGRYLSRLLRREVPATVSEFAAAVRSGRLRRPAFRTRWRAPAASAGQPSSSP